MGCNLSTPLSPGNHSGLGPGASMPYNYALGRSDGLTGLPAV